MKRYCITSAQAYASPHSKFWAGLQHYAKKMRAEIIVLPMIGQSAKEDWDKIHPRLANYVEYGKRKLNSNIKIEQFNIRPYQIDPITGLSRFAQQGTTLVFASPKQRMAPIPHSNQKYPKFLVTTGAVTHPNYATRDDVSAERRRLGDIARRDHVYGALVVEIVDDEKFHFRHLRANSEGAFVDLGVRYERFTEREAALEAMVCGDIHNGQSDETVMKVTFEMIRELKPRRLVLHDFFDGHSVNHHTEKKKVREKLIHMVDRGFHILEEELRIGYERLMEFNEAMEGRPIVVVFSNHHAFLHRYLEEGRYHHELTNFRISVKLLDYMAAKDYNDPVYAGMRMFGKIPRNIRFLREGDDYKVQGYQLGSHGDKGADGGYGSVNSKENAWGRSISGHTHKAAIIRNTYTVGTCLPRNMFYMRGEPSAWTHTHALLWDNASVQLVNIIDKYWRL